LRYIGPRYRYFFPVWHNFLFLRLATYGEVHFPLLGPTNLFLYVYKYGYPSQDTQSATRDPKSPLITESVLK